MISQVGKTVPEVCECTGKGMWKKFPGENYWYSDSFAGNQLDEAYGPTVIACIVE